MTIAREHMIILDELDHLAFGTSGGALPFKLHERASVVISTAGPGRSIMSNAAPVAERIWSDSSRRGC